jgi:hypothetical protein
VDGDFECILQWSGAREQDTQMLGIKALPILTVGAKPDLRDVTSGRITCRAMDRDEHALRKSTKLNCQSRRYGDVARF